MDQREKKQLLRRISESCNSSRPLTIAVVGTVGVAKSSLINSIATAMDTESWHEHAYVGHHGTIGDPVTAYTRRYPSCCRPQRHPNKNYPTLLDIGGLPDVLDTTWEHVLRLLFYGCIPESTNLLEAYNHLERNQRGRHRYTKTNKTMMVDRVVVVASATETVPQNLLEMIVKAALPTGNFDCRRIPIFCVVTKIDLIDIHNDDKFKENVSLIKDILGLNGCETRYLECSNYCSGIDPDHNYRTTSYPQIDIPILQMMTQICDPALEVVNSDTSLYPHPIISDLNLNWILYILILVLAYLCLKLYTTNRV